MYEPGQTPYWPPDSVAMVARAGYRKFQTCLNQSPAGASKWRIRRAGTPA